MKYRAEFFQPKEFRCPCCGGGQPAALLVLFLEVLRRTWGAHRAVSVPRGAAGGAAVRLGIEAIPALRPRGRPAAGGRLPLGWRAPES